MLSFIFLFYYVTIKSWGYVHQKKKRKETKDTLIEIKNNLQGYYSREDEAENQINDLEHKEAKINQSEQEEKIQKTRKV